MLTLSKKVEYALMAVLHMSALRPGELATAKDMSEAYGMPGELLGKVLQSLARENVIEAVLGSRGGYRLRRPVEDLTLGQVIEAVDGPVHLARCQEDPDQCGQFHACTIKEPVYQVHEQLMNFIHGISLASFRKPARPQPVTMEL
jgi:Rrf2 family protein